jgi:peptide/nickel transport system ATP-binding protein
MSPLLEIRDLTARYRTGRGELTAAREVSFELNTGQALGLVGESGSGKTTVAAAILDLLGPGASIDGQIRFEGTDLRGLAAKERRRLLGRRIGAVFQDPFTALNPAMTVGRQIAEPLIRHLGMSHRAAWARACELLADMHIDRPHEIAAAYPHQLSGGMRQRALIAAAMACEPALLILDEPTTALDVTVEAQILALLADLRRRRSVSLLLISHNLAVVRQVCDGLVVLYGSQVIETGPAATVLERPQHPYTKGLLASLPRLVAGGRGARLPTIAGRMAGLDRTPGGCFFHPRCPFAETSCRDRAQPLRALRGNRQVRCWKAEQLPPWPVGGTATARPPGITGHAATVRAVDLRKTFGISRGLAALRVDLFGRGPVIRYRPTRIAAVDSVSLSIAPGEVLGLVGESGSGKSTLGRLVLRLSTPNAGRVEFAGADVFSLKKRLLRNFRQKAQIVFQNADSSLNPRLSIEATLKRPLILFGRVAPRARDARVLELLDMVRLPRSYRTRYPHQLSGGEKQRVAIARALATDPEFVVCDEPVSALDVSVQAAIVNLMADLRDAFGLAYLFISHDLALVAQLADRIAVMYRGRICEIGTTAEVLGSPRHPYTQELLASVPRIDMERVRHPPLHRLINTAPDLLKGCAFAPRCSYKLGAVCDDVRPALRALSPTRSVACHLVPGPI